MSRLVITNIYGHDTAAKHGRQNSMTW